MHRIFLVAFLGISLGACANSDRFAGPQLQLVEEQPQLTDDPLQPAREELEQGIVKKVLVDSPVPQGDILIDTKNFSLDFGIGGGKAYRYGVGVGREGFGFHSVNMRVGAKQEWPPWNPPPEMIAREAAHNHIIPAHMDGNIGNPLGARAMYLFGPYAMSGQIKNEAGGDSLFRIHGTNEPRSIGTNVSSGCIRMRNSDVIDLYNQVRVGAKVTVL